MLSDVSVLCLCLRPCQNHKLCPLHLRPENHYQWRWHWHCGSQIRHRRTHQALQVVTKHLDEIRGDDYILNDNYPIYYVTAGTAKTLIHIGTDSTLSSAPPNIYVKALSSFKFVILVSKAS